jgi:AmiR/NasT family two-component response regulator
VQNHAEGSERHKYLRRKLGSRPAIEQAKGIIMCLRRCDQDTAFGELLLASQQSDRRLRDIAVALVA